MGIEGFYTLQSNRLSENLMTEAATLSCMATMGCIHFDLGSLGTLGSLLQNGLDRHKDDEIQTIEIDELDLGRASN